MTNAEMLKGLKGLMEGDGEYNQEARLVDVLDYLGVLGLEGASEMYLKMLKGSNVEGKQNAIS